MAQTQHDSEGYPPVRPLAMTLISVEESQRNASTTDERLSSRPCSFHSNFSVVRRPELPPNFQPLGSQRMKIIGMERFNNAATATTSENNQSQPTEPKPSNQKVDAPIAESTTMTPATTTDSAASDVPKFASQSMNEIDHYLTKLVNADFLDQSEINNFNSLLKTHEGRESFVRVLNIQRTKESGLCLPTIAFEQIVEFMRVAFTEADLCDDFKSSKSIMHMGSTFFRNLDGIHEHLSNRLKGLEIWKKIRFWEEALYESLVEERERTTSGKNWSELTVEEQREQIVRDRNTIFGLLGSFSYNMLSYGVTDEVVKKFIENQCRINLLTGEQKQMLLVNMQAMSMSLREVEAILSQKLHKEQMLTLKRRKQEAEFRQRQRRMEEDKNIIEVQWRENQITVKADKGSDAALSKESKSPAARQKLLAQIVEHSRISKRLSERGLPGGRTVAVAASILPAKKQTWEKGSNRKESSNHRALMGVYKRTTARTVKSREVSPEKDITSKIINPSRSPSPFGPTTTTISRTVPSSSSSTSSSLQSNSPLPPPSSFCDFSEIFSVLNPATERLTKLTSSFDEDFDIFSLVDSDGKKRGEKRISTDDVPDHASPPKSPKLKSTEVAAAAKDVAAQISALTAKILGKDSPDELFDDEVDDEFDEEYDDEIDAYFFSDEEEEEEDKKPFLSNTENTESAPLIAPPPKISALTLLLTSSSGNITNSGNTSNSGASSATSSSSSLSSIVEEKPKVMASNSPTTGWNLSGENTSGGKLKVANINNLQTFRSESQLPTLDIKTKTPPIPLPDVSNASPTNAKWLVVQPANNSPAPSQSKWKSHHRRGSDFINEIVPPPPPLVGTNTPNPANTGNAQTTSGESKESRLGAQRANLN